MAGIRTLLVDDSPRFRGMASRLLVASQVIEHVDEAASGQEALAKVAASAPDLVLLDLHLPDLSGLDVLRHVRRATPGTRVIIVTLNDTKYHRAAAFAAGADGFIGKADFDIELEPLIVRLFASGAQS